jgi:biotin carboxylase
MAGKKRVLLVATVTGYQVRVFADAGRRLGYKIVLATDRCHKMEDPWADQAIPIRFHKPKYSAHLARLAEVEGGKFDGIVAVGDGPAYIAGVIADRLGLRFHSGAATAAARNKFSARERFRAAGLPVPAYHKVSLLEDPEGPARSASYPCVLKPLGLSASRGVIRANNAVEFVAAFRRIRDILNAPEIRRLHEEQDRFLQVEEFIDGPEFALEGIVTAGRLKTLAIFDKPDPLDGPFFEETIYVTPSRESATMQGQMIETTQRAITALGLSNGPIHAEMRCNGRGVWMLEVAARPIGGLCAKALRFDGAMPLEELILRHAAGEDVSRCTLDGPASGVMMIPIPREGIYEGVGNVETAAAVPGIEEVTITAKEGQKLTPLPEGASYLGFVFARGEGPEAVERSLRAAHAELDFRIATTLPMFRYALDCGGR